MIYRNAFARFARSEEGAGTVFGLFIFVTLAMLLSLGLDATNSWRHRTYLTSSADMGAHAGAVAIANSQSRAAIVTEIERVIEWNAPPSVMGQILDNDTDVTLGYYDPETYQFVGYETGYDNAVVVSVEESTDRGNPLPTYLMQFLGIDRMHIYARSAAVFDYNPKCPGTDGIWATGQVTLTSLNDIGTGICIHSDDHVWLPQQNTFQEGSIVSMPNLADCKNKCEDSANPGINAVETNYVVPELNSFIMAAYNAFLDPMLTYGTKYDFFHDNADDDYDEDKPLDNNLSALVPVLGQTAVDLLQQGDVVNLPHSAFHTIPNLPSGLVYNVNCTAGGNGPNTRLVFDGGTGKMDGSVLVTNCSLKFEDGASVVGSVVITTRETNNAVITAGSDVEIGDPTGNCKSEDRSTIMAVSDVSVPAEFGQSNATMIIDGDVNWASGTSTMAASKGFSIYASGEVHIASQHTMRTCGNAGDFLVPRAKVLRLVVPPAI